MSFKVLIKILSKSAVWVNFEWMMFCTIIGYFLHFFTSLLKKEGGRKGEWSRKPVLSQSIITAVCEYIVELPLMISILLS